MAEFDSLSKDQVSPLAYMAQAIQQSRNMTIFEKKKFDFLNVICKAKRMWLEFLSTGNGQIIKETRRKKLQKWEKPIEANAR